MNSYFGIELELHVACNGGLHCDSNRSHPTKFSTNLTNKNRGGNNNTILLLASLKTRLPKQDHLESSGCP